MPPSPGISGSAADGGAFFEALLDQALGGTPLAVSGTGGAWGLVPYPPTSNVA